MQALFGLGPLIVVQTVSYSGYSEYSGYSLYSGKSSSSENYISQSQEDNFAQSTQLGLAVCTDTD